MRASGSGSAGTSGRVETKQQAEATAQQVQELQKMPGVYTASAPMCHWEMDASCMHQGQGYFLRRPKWITNSKKLAEALKQYSDKN